MELKQPAPELLGQSHPTLAAITVFQITTVTVPQLHAQMEIT